MPDDANITRMLDDIEAVTTSRFYADPDPIASPVEMLRMPEGKVGGEPFATLSVREKTQVLGDYTDWQRYEKHGVSMEQLDHVFWNVINDKPREKWLEGTGLDGLAAQKLPWAELWDKIMQHVQQEKDQSMEQGNKQEHERGGRKR